MEREPVPPARAGCAAAPDGTGVRLGGCAGDRGVHLSRPDPPRAARARHHLHPAPHTLMLEAFTHETFAGHEGEAFPIRLDDGSTLETRLQSARTWGSGSDGHRVPFTLTFVGPLQPVLPQRIYRLEHPEVGAFDLFLVPVGPNAQGMQYEAVFT